MSWGSPDFFFNDTATTEIYTLSLHDALPISRFTASKICPPTFLPASPWPRSEEHTSELQSLRHLVCRLLLEKKKHLSLGLADTAILMINIALKLIRRALAVLRYHSGTANVP